MIYEQSFTEEALNDLNITDDNKLSTEVKQATSNGLENFQC